MNISTRLLLGAISLAGVAAAAAPAFAQDAPPWALTGYVAATSDYRFRGISQNERNFELPRQDRGGTRRPAKSMNGARPRAIPHYSLAARRSSSQEWNVGVKVVAEPKGQGGSTARQAPRPLRRRVPARGCELGGRTPLNP